jgi:hypothetical protein
MIIVISFSACFIYLLAVFSFCYIIFIFNCLISLLFLLVILSKFFSFLLFYFCI